MILVDEMKTEFPFVEITPEFQKVVGQCDPGTRVYRKEGTERECGIWFEAVSWFAPTDKEGRQESFVSPGGVSMYAPVSRAAVHKRLKEGRLTGFCFHVVQKEKSLLGRVRKAKRRPYIYIPVSECKAWAEELKARHGSRDLSEWFADVEDHRDDEFLAKDPRDRGNRRVVYKEKPLTRVVILLLVWSAVEEVLAELLPGKLGEAHRRRLEKGFVWKHKGWEERLAAAEKRAEAAEQEYWAKRKTQEAQECGTGAGIVTDGKEKLSGKGRTGVSERHSGGGEPEEGKS